MEINGIIIVGVICLFAGSISTGGEGETTCPPGMSLDTEAENTLSFCDCIETYLYQPEDDLCYLAYKQGPCPKETYFVLPKEEQIARCVKNPCGMDGLVPYNGSCYTIGSIIIDQPCPEYHTLMINTKFQPECIRNGRGYAFIDAPRRQCTGGTRRTALGLCKNSI